MNNMEQKENKEESGNHISFGHANWFNKIKQGDGKQQSGAPFWKLVFAFLAALAAIAGVVTFLIKSGILAPTH